MRQQKARKIVEVGIGTTERAVRMIQIASEFYDPRDIHYTGIDLFEDRSESDGPGVPLKLAHRTLKGTGARIQLVPGTPSEAFSRIANSLGKIDMLVLSPRPDADQLAHAWFFIPRLLHDKSQVFLETPSPSGGVSFRLVDFDEIENLAGALRRRAA